MYKINMYFDPSGAYASRIPELLHLLEEIQRKWETRCDATEASMLSAEDIERLASSIRSIPPQVRGRIVSSGHHILPLSGKKRLNLKNTPVILVRKNDVPADVFPHLLGTRYVEPEQALSRILEAGPDEYIEARGILEDPLVKILSDYPGSLGRGTILVGRDAETGAGVIDLLLRDDAGNDVVIEVETRARDPSVAQVCRLAAGYAKTKNIPLERVRKVIVCLEYEGNLPTTCMGSGVELYEMRLVKVSQ